MESIDEISKPEDHIQKKLNKILETRFDNDKVYTFKTMLLYKIALIRFCLRKLLRLCRIYLNSSAKIRCTQEEIFVVR